MKSIIFWDMTPCSLLSPNRHFGGTYRCLVLAEIISSTLKMEAICSSETSVSTQQTKRRHIPEYDTLGKLFTKFPAFTEGYINYIDRRPPIGSILNELNVVNPSTPHFSENPFNITYIYLLAKVCLSVCPTLLLLNGAS
jgi:hypothetical protein